ncbi:MAG: ATP-dependent RecD-like DNA helicase [Deltaproteobacteria bacterium]|nr:ATP-dependent RecD-like DNA helicase [Deltaproteobacteria bacterium]
MERIEGTVEKVIFARPEEGYAVLSLRVVEQLLPVTVIGNLVGVQPGETMEISGRWEHHRQFGRRFRVDQFAAGAPRDEEGLLRYLQSGVINGIGPQMAERLVAAFGTKLFELTEDDPLILMQVPGIGKKRAKTIARVIAEQREVRDVMVFLQGLGLGPGMAGRIYRAWGKDAEARVRKDPYRLAQEVEGFGFLSADTIAQKLGVDPTSGTRLEAGLLHMLRSSRDEGHTVIGREDLVTHTATFLETDLIEVERALAGVILSRVLEARSSAEGEDLVGLPALVYAEENMARDLHRLGQMGPRNISPKQLDDAAEVSLTEEQRSAVELAARGPVSVITGGPGTGKTTVIRSLVRLLNSIDERCWLCAPTGRAAKRLSEASQAPATTVHRLLGFKGISNEGVPLFEHGRKNPLGPGTVILDEASMLDAMLGRRLLEALGMNRLVLVGDANQLPSVGAGNVLADLIRSDGVPVAELSTIFRQAESSQIVVNAHRIRQGLEPEPSGAGALEEGAFHLVRVDDPQRAQQRVLEVCSERIPRAFGLDPINDVQVISPMHRGDVGTVMLNRELQRRLNPGKGGIERGPEAFRVGDKVMQVRNDHEREVYNGDVGRIVSIDSTGPRLVVKMGEELVRYEPEQLRQLSLAYCISIHKSQGSEYPAVVIPLTTQHYLLLQRNLLYTAITRAKKLVVLVASPQALRIAVERTDSSLRRTRLLELVANAELGF